MLKKLFALVLAGAMVLGSVNMSFADDPEPIQYTITINNTNKGVNLEGEEVKAYELFDLVVTDGTTTTEQGLDPEGHTYYFRADNQFFDGLAGWQDDTHAWAAQTETTAEGNAAAVDGPIMTILKQYFMFTPISGDNTKVIVTSKVDEDGNNLFTAATGYELVKQLKVYIDGRDAVAADPDAEPPVEGVSAISAATPNATATVTGQGYTGSQVATINVTGKGDAGYYLVTANGHPYKEDGQTVDTGNTIEAAIALTSTDPAGTIIAKLDGPSLDKRIDEGEQDAIAASDSSAGQAEADVENKVYDLDKDGNPVDLKYDQHAIGDTVPFVLKTTVPNMTGYEQYFFYVADQMSAGLTLQDGTNGTTDSFQVTINGTLLTKKTEAEVAAMAKDSTDQVYYVRREDNAEGTYFEIVFHNMLQYRGDLITAEDGLIPNPDYDADAAAAATDESPYTVPEKIEKPGFDKATIGTYANSLTGTDIVITYNAKVNDLASVGEIGNPNTAQLIYSNNPYKKDEGTPEHPDIPSSEYIKDEVTGITPESTTVTYTTGVQFIKVDISTLNSDDLVRLANAKFTLASDKLNDIKETHGYYFREAIEGETAEYYRLKDNTYTKTAPTDDMTTVETIPIEGSENGGVTTHTVIYRGTKNQYLDTTPKYVRVEETYTVSSPATENAKIQNLTTDSDGTLSFTGLKEGIYTLTENEAPAGYNVLQHPIKFEVVWEAPSNDGTANSVGKDDAATWHIYMWDDGATTREASTNVIEITPNAKHGNLLAAEIGNAQGTELPSTGGIGTTLFYAGGAILVLLAGVLLVSKRRIA